MLRADLNVPMKAGKVTDTTRIDRVIPTIKELIANNAKVIICSHFGRPKGEFNIDYTLAPIADEISAALGNTPVKFAVDSIGSEATRIIDNLQNGDVCLLENLRFHAQEKANNAEFSKALASLADVYVNDAFSCSHRAHASIVGVTALLPSAIGRLMQAELSNLEKHIGNANAPITAVIGGAKISTKLGLIDALIDRTDNIVIGGGMANTFLKAMGNEIGTSLCEDDLLDTARNILAKAKANNCEILLPMDVICVPEFKAGLECLVCDANNVPADQMILDAGPKTVANLVNKLADTKTIIWNGPLGAFEMHPYDNSTVSLARFAAGQTAAGKMVSIAGGGDTIYALKHACVDESFTYCSTAGGAFLQWLEGKELPGLAALKS